MGHHRAGDGDEPVDLTVEQVRSTLRDAADAYRPDRAAMVDRVASGRAAPPEGGARRTPFRMNPLAAAFAVAVILVASISAARLSSGGPQGTAAAHRPSAGAPAGTGAGSSSASTPAGSTPAVPTPAGSPAGSPAAGTTGGVTTRSSRTPSGPPRNGPSATATLPMQATPNGFLASEGALDANSGPVWSQNNVTITTSKPIVALTVTITVALTPGVKVHGRYTDAPNADMTLAVTPTRTALVYTYTLNDGRRLTPGAYRFAAQFSHKPGRDDTDSYTVVARTADTGAELTGDFTR